VTSPSTRCVISIDPHLLVLVGADYETGVGDTLW
jgi:hypothetical protein